MDGYLLNRPLQKLDNDGFARIFDVSRGSDDAHPEGALGTADEGLRQKSAQTRHCLISEEV